MLQERLTASEPIEREELRHALNVIHQGASDSVETVRRLQEYSRPARVKGPEAVLLRDVLEQLLALARPQWDSRAAAARHPPRDRSTRRSGASDPGRGQRGARGAAQHSGERADRDAAGRPADAARPRYDDRAVVSISDTERGMSPEVQRLAFEPFFTTRSTEGRTDLGEPRAGIVQRYRGTIALDSAEA